MSGNGGIVSNIDKSLDVGIASNRVFVVNDLAGRRVTTPIAIISALQAFTGSWVALGPQLSMDGFNKITIWLNLNLTAPKNTVNARIRLRARHTDAGTLYSLPVYNVTATGTPFNIQVEGEYIELNTDLDQTLALTWTVENTMPFVLFEISAETAGGTPGAVTTAEVTYSY